MGIVVRQSLKFTIINILLVIIGALSVLFIYPQNLALYGELNMFYFTANLLLPLTSLGFSNVVLKYHQIFKEREKSDDFLIFSLIGTNVFAFFGLILFVALKAQVLLLFEFYRIPKDFVDTHYTSIAILSFFLINNATLVYYSSIQKRIVVPEIITNGGYKFLLPLIILFSLFYPQNIELYFNVIILFYLAVFILLFLYASRLHPWRLGFSFATLGKFEKIEGLMFSISSSVNNFFYHLILKLDLLLVGIFLSPTYAGIYAIFIFLVSLLEIPNRSLTQITTPLVSSYLNGGNKIELKKLYVGTSLNLFIVGSFVFLIIIYNFRYFIQYIEKIPFEASFNYVILFLGLSRLIDMSFGINSQIILFSKKYYVYNIFTVFCGLTNLILSYALIQSYGMSGIAFSVLFSITLFNVLKFVYIWYEMRILPLSIGHLKTGICFIAALLCWGIFPDFNNLYLGSFISTSFICIIYLGLVLYFKPSDILYENLVKYSKYIFKYSRN